jgi:MarR family transcriptional regulator for hemolysin
MNTARQAKERELTRGMLRIARIYRKEVNRSLTAYGISDAQAVPVLHIARFGGGIRQTMLAEEIGIEGPSLVRLLDQLCLHGLVERHDDSRDRRAKTLHLTAAGEALAVRVEAALQELRGRLLAPVSDSALEATLATLAALDAGLRDIDAPSGDDA